MEDRRFRGAAGCMTDALDRREDTEPILLRHDGAGAAAGRRCPLSCGRGLRVAAAPPPYTQNVQTPLYCTTVDLLSYCSIHGKIRERERERPLSFGYLIYILLYIYIVFVCSLSSYIACTNGTNGTHFCHEGPEGNLTIL